MTKARVTTLLDRFQGLVSRIPGYDGYRDKEKRRDEDKRVREASAAILVAVVDRLTQRNAALVAERKLTDVSRIERLIGQTRLLADRVRTATYGYGGIFSDRSVDGPVLDQLRQFDLSMQAELLGLEASAGKVAGGDETSLTAYETELGRLTTLFDARGQVIETARPTEDRNVLALLETETEPEPSPLFGIAVGETFSVLGDNFQVDATVSIADGDLGISLARVAEGDWFLGSTDGSIGSARLIEGEGQSGTTPGRPARIAIRSGKGEQEEVAGQYMLSNGGTEGLTLAFTIGTQTRTFAGQPVNDMDIERFGAAPAQDKGGS
jgi:hypothetical protein